MTNTNNIKSIISTYFAFIMVFFSVLLEERIIELNTSYRIVKMTSPNINVVILVGVISAYVCMPVLVVDSGQVTVEVLASLSQVRLTIRIFISHGSVEQNIEKSY